MFDKKMRERSTLIIRRMNELTAKLLNFYSNPNKKPRLSAGLCKCCAYVNTSRIGGAALTSRKYDSCSKELNEGG